MTLLALALISKLMAPAASEDTSAVPSIQKAPCAMPSIEPDMTLFAVQTENRYAITNGHRFIPRLFGNWAIWRNPIRRRRVKGVTADVLSPLTSQRVASGYAIPGEES
jgi:hypothetical protein